MKKTSSHAGSGRFCPARPSLPGIAWGKKTEPGLFIEKKNCSGTLVVDEPLDRESGMGRQENGPIGHANNNILLFLLFLIVQPRDADRGPAGTLATGRETTPIRRSCPAENQNKQSVRNRVVGRPATRKTCAGTDHWTALPWCVPAHEPKAGTRPVMDDTNSPVTEPCPEYVR